MASTSVQKQAIHTATTKDAESPGKGGKGQSHKKGKQSAKGRAASKLGTKPVSTEEQQSADQAEDCEDGSTSAATSMEDKTAAIGKKAPPFKRPPGMAEMMKMMGDMPEDLKKIMATKDMKNFSFNSFVEDLCMAAWHADDDSTGSPMQHIPEGSDSRRLLMALARGDSEGETAAESLNLVEGGAFKKPFSIARAVRGKKLAKQDNISVEPVRTTRSRRSSQEAEKVVVEEPGSPTDKGRHGGSRATKRAAEEEEEGPAAPAEEEIAFSKKRRILVSLIKGDAKSSEEQGTGDQGKDAEQEESAPRGGARSSKKGTEEPAPPSEPSSRLKKNAKNFVGREIVSGDPREDKGEQEGGLGEGSHPSPTSCDSEPPSSSASNKNECAVCGDQFDTKYYVKNHMKIHSGERPFACEECGKTFSHKASLKAHMEVHGREVQNFYCELCDRKFEYAYLLERHNKSHERHQCKTCGKCMCNAQALASHMRSEHSAKFSYECDVCGKSYSRFSAFVAHQQTHADNPSAKENVEFEDGLGGDSEDVVLPLIPVNAAGSGATDMGAEQLGPGEEGDSGEVPRVIAVPTA